MFAFVNGDPISGAVPSNGIILEPVKTPSCVNIEPALPLLAITKLGVPILAPV